MMAGNADSSALPADQLTSRADALVIRWNAALAHYRQLRAFSDSLPDDDPRADAAVEAYCVAMDVLIHDLSPPDEAALEQKMAFLRERWEDDLFMVEVLPGLLRDVRRLAVEGAPRANTTA